MRTLLLLPLLFLIACAKASEGSIDCTSDFSNSLFVGSQSYECLNSSDTKSTYKVIALSGGDTSITDPTAYKADLKAKFVTAKSRATKVLYFSSPVDTATALQMTAAQEAAIEESITTYDLYSMSIAKPDEYQQWVINSIASWL